MHPFGHLAAARRRPAPPPRVGQAPSAAELIERTRLRGILSTTRGEVNRLQRQLEAARGEIAQLGERNANMARASNAQNELLRRAQYGTRLVVWANRAPTPNGAQQVAVLRAGSFKGAISAARTMAEGLKARGFQYVGVSVLFPDFQSMAPPQGSVSVDTLVTATLTTPSVLRARPDLAEAVRVTETLPAGIDFIVQQRQGDWLLVMTPSGVSGWVPANLVTLSAAPQPAAAPTPGTPPPAEG